MVKRIEQALRFAVLALIVGLAGCDDSGSTNPINATYLHAPRVTGLWFRTSSGEVLGYWGFPPGQSALQSLFNYPNPFNPRTTIRIAVPQRAHVRLWVVRALGPGETQEDLVPLFDAGYIKPGGAPLDILVDRELEPGTHDIDWDASAYPDGFYCYYVAIGDEWLDSRFALLWREHSGESFDVLFADRPWIKFD